MTDVTPIRRMIADSQVRVAGLRARREAAVQSFYGFAMSGDKLRMDHSRLEAQTAVDAEMDELVTQTMLMRQLIDKCSGL